jgi:hypothetical protein
MVELYLSLNRESIDLLVYHRGAYILGTIGFDEEFTVGVSNFLRRNCISESVQVRRAYQSRISDTLFDKILASLNKE